MSACYTLRRLRTYTNLSLEQSKIRLICDKREIAECAFDNELIDEFGKTVFLTREDAEKKLEELKNECK